MALYVTVPDTMSAGRSRGYVPDTRHMPPGLELRDSVTSRQLARAVQQASGASMGGRYQLPDGIPNPADAGRALSIWVDVPRAALDQVSGNPGTK